MTVEQTEQRPENTPEARLLGMIFNVDPALPFPQQFVPERQAAVQAALNRLADDRRKIINLRYGFADGRNRTLEQVAKELNVTRERIRQIEGKALRILHHPSRSTNLRLFVPLSENSLGKRLWEVNIGYEINLKLSPVDIRTITLENLHFSPYPQEAEMWPDWRYIIPLSRIIHLNANDFPEEIPPLIKERLEDLQAQALGHGSWI